jgi:A/G-specific adenine glycosylase
MVSEISSRLLAWYACSAREMPWRGHPDPYAIWVSEIMLQQTQVDTVRPYFTRWMEKFPTLAALAEADEQAVLQVWEGLGYYSRARNLHRAARLVMAEYNGQLPASASELKKLPGIGRYTAGAIASIAFNQDEPALDGNIRRVFARLYDLDLPSGSPAFENRLWQLVTDNLPPGRAGDYNQAIMDLGATLCTPHNPTCMLCPLQEICLAQAQGTQELRPVTAARPAVPHITVAAAVIQRDGKIFLARRPSKGLLGGMWEFPGGKQEPGETLEQTLHREIREELATEIEVKQAFGVYQHAYSHFRVTLHAFLCQLSGPEPTPLEASELVWANKDELNNYPMGKIDRQIANRLAV